MLYACGERLSGGCCRADRLSPLVQRRCNQSYPYASVAHPFLSFSRALSSPTDSVRTITGVYSRTLMADAAQCVVSLNEDADSSGCDARTPALFALEEAYGAIASDGTQGSCTATIAVLDGDTSMLSTISVGDSGVVVLRDGAVLYESEHQQHGMFLLFQS